MFSKNKKAAQSKAASSSGSSIGKGAAPSVISADMNILGNIVTEGFVDIDGKIDGNVKCDSAIIRTNGSVRGDVVANNVQIYGYVEGLVKATVVNLYSSAHVSGSIMHESLSIEDGAFVDGKFKRTDKVFIDDDGAEGRFDDDSQDMSEDDEDDSPERVMDNLKLISQ